MRSSPPSDAPPHGRRQHRLVLTGGDGGDAIGAPAVRGRRGRLPTTARLSASVPPDVKNTSFGSTPSGLGHLAPGLLQAGPRRTPEAVRARRVAEGLPAEIRQHGVQHLGANRGRGGVVEVDGMARDMGSKSMGYEQGYANCEAARASGLSRVEPRSSGPATCSAHRAPPRRRP